LHAANPIATAGKMHQNQRELRFLTGTHPRRIS
jgi:hypothetical protein